MSSPMTAREAFAQVARIVRHAQTQQAKALPAFRAMVQATLPNLPKR